MKVEVAISLCFLFPLYKYLLWFALFSNLIVSTFRYYLFKITVEVNNRDVPNYYNRVATEIHRTEKNHKE